MGSARRSWAGANGDALTGFIRAYVRCLDWIFDPANRTAAARILASHRDGMSPEAAAKAVAQLVSDDEGLTPKAALAHHALVTVIELRDRFGEPRKELADPERYIDLSYHEAAIGSFVPK